MSRAIKPIMKNKNLITASLLLVPAFCLGSGRAPSAGRPADLRDALRDSTPLEELKAQGANEAAAIPQAAKGYAQPGGKATSFFGRVRQAYFHSSGGSTHSGK